MYVSSICHLLPTTRLRRLKRSSSCGEKWATQRCTVGWSTFNAFGHHLFQIAQAQSVGQVPAHAQQDHRLVEMAALEHHVLLHS
ncbi:hypothetical protein X740_23465 [Mesorhizobium sp. LNHC221B00]|nr:hypothetical protein X740_23465 [Mesorhizobium sp. LNHC221B00]